MARINGSKFSEFIDRHRGESFQIQTLRTDNELLKSAGIDVSLEKKVSNRRDIRTLEYLLLRTSLYRPGQNKTIVPFLIDNNWQDYTRSWIKRIKGREFHLPFFGHIAFVSTMASKKTLICHPNSLGQVDEIIVNTGALVHQFGPGPKRIGLNYHTKICSEIISLWRSNALSAEYLASVRERDFIRLIIMLGLAHENGDLSLTRRGEFLSEIQKTSGENDIERAAKLLLEREHQLYSQVSSVIAALENMERQQSPIAKPIGEGPAYVKKEGKKQDLHLTYYDVIEEYCSINNRVASNVLNTHGAHPTGFSDFGSYIDVYHHISSQKNGVILQNFAFLSFSTDLLGFLVLDQETIGDLVPDDRKVRSLRRHRDYLEKAIPNVNESKDPKDLLSMLRSRSLSTTILDFNVAPMELTDIHATPDTASCLSKVYVIDKVPVKKNLIIETCIAILQGASDFKNSQGAFYYPDFRFLLASELVLPLFTIDKVLAYTISTEPDFARRIWFFPSFGRIPLRDSPSSDLIKVVARPFDHITLNY